VTETPVEWTATARQDLRSIIRYIARDNPENAQGVLARLQARAATLVGQPERGRVVPELRAIGVLHYQEIIERPLRIVYRVQADRVLVLAMLDGRRSLSAVLMERLVRS
jgi:plasmid stabilization system protein ParE